MSQSFARYDGLYLAAPVFRGGHDTEVATLKVGPNIETQSDRTRTEPSGLVNRRAEMVRLPTTNSIVDRKHNSPRLTGTAPRYPVTIKTCPRAQSKSSPYPEIPAAIPQHAPGFQQMMAYSENEPPPILGFHKSADFIHRGRRVRHLIDCDFNLVLQCSGPLESSRSVHSHLVRKLEDTQIVNHFRTK